MTLSNYIKIYLPAVETELRSIVRLANSEVDSSLHDILSYHMGWQPAENSTAPTGKRVRPLLLLLCCSAAGGSWQDALPAAAGVELVHNFSLIHDDIEDSSPTRRGRPTVWSLHGIPLAINAGDAMFTLAHIAALRLQTTCPLDITLKAVHLIQETCLKLTQGQHLDMSYELREDLVMTDYWPMISGKTAMLLAVSAQLGALIAGKNEQAQAEFNEFGRCLGLAFQVQDDILGIWGDSVLTGKSADSDLVSGKKTIPVIYGLEQAGSFASRWRSGPISTREARDIAQMLEDSGARRFCQAEADRLTAESLSALQRAQPDREAGAALLELAYWLLKRDI